MEKYALHIPMADNSSPIVDVRGLCKDYAADNGKRVRAVNHVSFSIAKGEVLGVVRGIWLW